ncbi:MAG: hypothetical protein KIPDCIKN_00458 [Haliscomenobacter sp.]|nr:hypothetical protein [Haliscomenobacter sp.]
MLSDHISNDYQTMGTAHQRYFGKYRATVIDNNDPENWGRLAVTVPGLLDTEILTADPCVPAGGKDMGIFMLPEPGAGVWVEFQAGDLNHPIWTGCYWADKESPSNSSQKRMIRSKTGMTICLDDEEELVTISDKHDENIITIDVNQGKITVKGNNTVVIEAPSVQLGGDSATQPVVMGLDLMNYLLALEAWVVPKGPIPPPSAVFRFLSSKVKTL